MFPRTGPTYHLFLLLLLLLWKSQNFLKIPETPKISKIPKNLKNPKHPKNPKNWRKKAKNHKNPKLFTILCSSNDLHNFRFCLIIFTTFTIVTTIAVLFSAPHILVEWAASSLLKKTYSRRVSCKSKFSATSALLQDICTTLSALSALLQVFCPKMYSLQVSWSKIKKTSKEWGEGSLKKQVVSAKKMTLQFINWTFIEISIDN